MFGTLKSDHSGWQHNGVVTDADNDDDNGSDFDNESVLKQWSFHSS